LGITDIYSSPYFQAGEKSTHGYDIANHNALNPALGGESAYKKFIETLHHFGMGQLLDFVPNHMGISESLNLWWRDVLENGTESKYASYFDIDWHPRKKELSEKVLLPILGDRYGKVLESGELILKQEGGAFVVHYFGAIIPINPRTYPLILNQALSALGRKNGERLSRIITVCEAEESDKKKAKAELGDLIASEPEVDAEIKSVLEMFNGIPGSKSSYDALHNLLDHQAYRLSFWRVAAEEINYRRFFDVNTLAAIRIEVPDVFEAAHHFVFQLLARGDVTGLRIDHIDGLWNPQEYIARLQKHHTHLSTQDESEKGLYLVVEKILDAKREHLPEDWNVSGTTGYEFANQVTNVLIDTESESHFTQTYQRFVGYSVSFNDVAYEKKRLVMESLFQSEILLLGRQLDEISEFYRDYRDFTRTVLTNAIREVIACFPVYRTYACPSHPPLDQDERAILRAISLARRRNPTIEKSVFDFLRNLLLMRFSEELPREQYDTQIHFLMKFQQCTSPVTAKGVEDTALYLYNRFIALNEVGGNPGDFGMTISDFHRVNGERCSAIPHTMLATSTHDTKRSEDVRMRMAALSQLPWKWRSAVRNWKRINRRHLVRMEEEVAPSSNEEYFLYQTLVGAWPLDLTPETRPDFVERIQNYMAKALKEGKINSSWTDPNEEWEKAVSLFIARILDPETGAAFQKEFLPLAEEVALLGAWNSLSATILKSTAPGVPDFYQGTEAWDFSLVDPDNRRPVDFACREQLLKSSRESSPEDLIADWKSGRIKIATIQRLLRFRREHDAFFKYSDYNPCTIEGIYAKHGISFRRTEGAQALIVFVPRLTASIKDFPLAEAWHRTSLQDNLLPGTWRNILTDEIYSLPEKRVSLADILKRFPFAVLYRK
jgi:(1->4)-alpha-D-glucan 1-alpha-D-glucosylmutase